MQARKRIGLAWTLATCASVSASVALVHSTAAQEDLPRISARHIRGLPDFSNPFALRMPRREASKESYQFVATWQIGGNNADARGAKITLICECREGTARLLILSHEGLPVAFVGDQGAYFVEPHANRITHLRGVKFESSLGGSSLVPKLKFSTDIAESSCTLDAHSLVQRLLSNDGDWEYSNINGRYRIERSDGAIGCIELSRRSERGGYPISLVSVNDGEGSEFELTHLCCSSDGPPSLAKCDALITSGALGPVHPSEASNDVVTRLFPFHDPDALHEVFGHENTRAIGTRWRRRLFLSEPEIAEIYSDRLDALESALQGDAQADSKAIAVVDDICGHLLGAIYEKAIETSDPVQRMPVAGGWGADRARLIFDWTYGEEVRHRTEGLLAGVVASEAFPKETRLQAADYLGVIGFCDAPVLQQLRTACAQDPALKAVVAAVAVRARAAREEDIAVIHDAVREEENALWVRLVCLEAAFLADRAEGVERPATDIISTVEFGGNHAGRCMLAAACSGVGRSMLLTGAKEGWAAFPAEITLSLARWSTRENTEGWEEFIEVAQSIALDKTRSVSLRKHAIQMAAQTESDRARWDSLVRESLRSSKPELISAAMAACLLRNKGGDEYIVEFAQAFREGDLRTKKTIAFGMSMCLTEPLNDEAANQLLAFCDEAEEFGDPFLIAIADQIRAEHLQHQAVEP